MTVSDRGQRQASPVGDPRLRPPTLRQRTGTRDGGRRPLVRDGGKGAGGKGLRQGGQGYGTVVRDYDKGPVARDGGKGRWQGGRQ